MDRKNFFYRQLVTEAEIDAAFTDVDNGFKNLLVDQGLSGVVTGFTPSAPSVAPYQVTLSSGVAYSKTLGRRLNYAGGVVSLATDELGNPVTLPLLANGDIRIVSIFLEPVYTETDPRTDGYGNPVNFVRTESITVRVVASAIGASLTVPAPPALRSDQILIADVVTYRDSGVDNIFVVTAEPVVTTSVSPAGTFTVNPRVEYLMPVLAGDYLGDGVTLGGKVKDAVSNLALKLKGYQTANTLSSLAASPANSADVNHPASHDAFTAGGAFQNKPGFYLLKKIAGVSTYAPTVDMVFSPDQEVSGGSPGAANHVLDLDANSVDLNLVTEGRFALKNLTVKGTTSSYRVATSAGPNAVEFENVTLDPITPGNKLFFNVHNANASRFRKNYGLILKGVDSGSSNLVMGARVDAAGLPITNVEDLVSGNLTIDGHGGYYRNIRLEGTDTASAVLNITGDNNIIENLVVASPLGDAPMISISGRNNIVRNVYLHDFDGHGSNFKAIHFTGSSVNNQVGAVYIQGGSNAFTGVDTDIADGGEWTPAFVTSITDLAEDSAKQPLADTVEFSANAGSQVTTTGLTPPTGVCVVEVWAKNVAGNGTFKVKSGAGLNPTVFTATSEWQRFRNVITSSNTQTVIANGDATAKTITFAHPARYTLTTLGSIDLITLEGSFNSIEGLVVENLQGLSSGNSIINFISSTNKVSNVTLDGLYAIDGKLLNGKINVDGFKLVNSHTITSAEYLLRISGTSILRNVDLDISNLAYRNTSVTGSLLYVTGSVSTDKTIIENVRLVGTSAAVYIDGNLQSIVFRDCLIHCIPSGAPTTLEVLNSTNIVFDNCKVIQDSNGKLLSVTLESNNITFLGCKFYSSPTAVLEDDFNVISNYPVSPNNFEKPIAIIDCYLEVRNGDGTTTPRVTFNRSAGSDIGTGAISIDGLTVVLNYAAAAMNPDMFVYSSGDSGATNSSSIQNLKFDLRGKRLTVTNTRALLFKGNYSKVAITDLSIEGVSEPDLTNATAGTCSLVALFNASISGGEVTANAVSPSFLTISYWESIFQLNAVGSNGSSVREVKFWGTYAPNRGRLFYLPDEGGKVKNNTVVVTDIHPNESAEGWFCYAIADRCIISGNDVTVTTGFGSLTTNVEIIRLTSAASYCQVNDNIMFLPGEIRGIGTEGDYSSIIGNTIVNDFATTVYPIRVYNASFSTNIASNILINTDTAGTSSVLNERVATIFGGDAANLGVVASTAQDQNGGMALGLTGDYIQVSTCANQFDSIALPTAHRGRRITVVNDGAQTLRVFPNLNDDLGAGVDLPAGLPSGESMHFIAISSTTWLIESQSTTIFGMAVVGSPTRTRFINPTQGKGLGVVWNPLGGGMSTTAINEYLYVPLELPSASVITSLRIGVTVTDVPGASNGVQLALIRLTPITSGMGIGTVTFTAVSTFLGPATAGTYIIATPAISETIDRGSSTYMVEVRSAKGGATSTLLSWIEVQFTDAIIWNG